VFGQGVAGPTSELYDLVETGKHMVGSLFPSAAGATNEGFTGTYAEVDDWASGTASSDGVSRATTTDVFTITFDVSGLAAGVVDIFGIMTAYQLQMIVRNTSTLLQTGYSQGAGVVAISSNIFGDTNVLRQVGDFASTNALTSAEWTLADLTTLEVMFQNGTLNAASNNTFAAEALAIRYLGILPGGGASYGFIIG
jgi:hypothetical protein